MNKKASIGSTIFFLALTIVLIYFLMRIGVLDGIIEMIKGWFTKWKWINYKRSYYGGMNNIKDIGNIKRKQRKMNNYLVEVRILRKFGYETKLIIQSGTIKEIKKNFIPTSRLRFFKLGEEEWQ